MTNLDIDVEVGGGGGGGSVAVSPLILTANVPTETPLTLVGASGQHGLPIWAANGAKDESIAKKPGGIGEHFAILGRNSW